MDSVEWTAAVKVALAELKAKSLNKGALTGASALIAGEEKEVVSSDSDTKNDSDKSPVDPRAHAGKDDATAELVQKLAEED
eukprot:scaffold264421_cov67-Attheya_sp.AAC.1